MIPAYVVYQKNKGQVHDCFSNEKENVNCGFKLYQFILSTLKGTCTSTV